MESSFKYRSMTPELAAYLKIANTYAGRDAGDGDEEYAVKVALWNKEHMARRSALRKSEYEAYTRSKLVWGCREETKTDESLIESPSGRYQIKISRHETKAGYVDYIKAVVTSSAGDVIRTLYRNYPSFPLSFIEEHSDGHDYLISGEKYTGFTVLRLTGARARTQTDGTWCQIKAYPSPDGTMLAVVGCYWAAPFEVRIYDTSNPLNVPWPRLAEELDSNLIGFGGWLDRDSCAVVYEASWCIPEGKWEHELTTQEKEKYWDAPDTEWDVVWEDRPEISATWNRGEGIILPITP